MKIKTVWSPFADPEDFDNEVNDYIQDGWEVVELFAPAKSGFNTIKYVAFLLKED